MVEQITAVHEHTKSQSEARDEALIWTLLELRASAVWCLNELGDSAGQAIAIGQELIIDRERALGDTHPDTLTSRNNLALTDRDAGRLDEARALLDDDVGPSRRSSGVERRTSARRASGLLVGGLAGDGLGGGLP